VKLHARIRIATAISQLSHSVRHGSVLVSSAARMRYVFVFPRCPCGCPILRVCPRVFPAPSVLLSLRKNTERISMKFAGSNSNKRSK